MPSEAPKFLTDFFKENGREHYFEKASVEENASGGFTVATLDYETYVVLGMCMDTWGCTNRDGYWVAAATIDGLPVELLLSVRIKEHDGQREESFSQLVSRLT